MRGSVRPRTGDPSTSVYPTADTQYAIVAARTISMICTLYSMHRFGNASTSPQIIQNRSRNQNRSRSSICDRSFADAYTKRMIVRKSFSLCGLSSYHSKASTNSHPDHIFMLYRFLFYSSFLFSARSELRKVLFFGAVRDSVNEISRDR